MDPYQIPAATTRIEHVVSNSRFIATVACAPTSDDARHFISEIRSEMPDASHHVYAFRAGYGNSIIEGMSDDGEPSGTAGPPILSILRGIDIGDIAVVVTRYFGGTKLGTGGLVRAYSEACRLVLKEMPLIDKIHYATILLEFPYTYLELIKRIIDQHDGEIKDESYTDSVLIQLRLPHKDVDALEIEIRNLTANNYMLVQL